MTLGVFERTTTAEPKSAPGTGLSCSVWFGDLRPIAEHSGLAATSARLMLRVRIHGNMLAEPQDDIDPALVKVLDVLMAAYTADFTLDGEIAYVDVLGAHGTPLQAVGGYVEIDNKLFRIITIELPMVINDAYPQLA